MVQRQRRMIEWGCWTAVIVAYVLASLLSGCGGTVDEEGAVPRPEDVEAPDPCGMAFESLSPELDQPLAETVSRWSKATGCDVRVGPGGYVVELWPALWGWRDASGALQVDSVPRAGSHRMCGFTDYGLRRILVTTACRAPVSMTLCHEEGHALAPGSDAKFPGGHASSGVMATNTLTATDVIDGPSLEFICSDLDCAGFVPEG